MREKAISCLRLVPVEIGDVDKVVYAPPLYGIFWGSTKIGRVGRSGPLSLMIDPEEWTASIFVTDGMDGISINGHGDTAYGAITNALENGGCKIANALNRTHELQEAITGIVINESLVEGKEAPVRRDKVVAKRRPVVRQKKVGV